MKAERIIEQILSTRPEISREKILKRLEKEKRKTSGFIANDVLLRMIAAELGVEVSKETPTLTLSIQDLVSGLNDVTVVGRAVAVFPSKTFTKGKSGKVASLLIADKNSILRVVIWNDKTCLIDSGKVKVGQVIRFLHGYTREDYGGRVELHLGGKGEIEVNPNDIEAKDYPTISRFITKIGGITRTNKKVSVTGSVEKVFPTSTFERQDSSSGKVMRFIFADETGSIPVVVWNKKVDELDERLKKGVNVQIVNAKVKKAVSEGLEIHVNSGTYVEVIEPMEEFSKMADLKEGLKHVNVKGAIITQPVLRNIKTSKGELVKLAVFELKDETGRIWVSAWRKHANPASDLKLGNKVIIKNAYVKRGFGDQLELSTRNATSIIPFRNEIEEQN